MTNERIWELTGVDIDALIRVAESGAHWAEIARIEVEAIRKETGNDLGNDRHA